MELRLVSIKNHKAVIARTRLGGNEAIWIRESKLESISRQEACPYSSLPPKYFSITFLSPSM